MSRYRTCRESEVKPKLSTVDEQHPYELEYMLVEWTGAPREKYDSFKMWQRWTTDYNRFVIVTSTHEDEPTCYLCRTWDDATLLRTLLSTQYPDGQVI